ncbi:MAG: hypothetical protein Q8L79_05270 [Methylobacter sp.]|uniref:hypothetical protein n=1 Tax=Methylobacter sp. TaxID=2051955 RepID=UPI00273030E6|nr:hypothetical protein [Methylobacter sp.]MDP1664520.1 hypothetical protein [Methylobacter sp.]
MNKTTAYFPAMIACAVFLTGCFFRPSPPTSEEQAEKVGQFIAEGGYSPAHSYAIDSIRETWRHDGQAVEISMLAPTAPGVYPLIIYLPGLGEHADGGRLWRETWAKAGYAVFSMQPLEIGEALKELGPMQGMGDDAGPAGPPEDEQGPPGDNKSMPSKALRNSELHYLGHEYFSQESLNKRINHLLWAHAQLKLRSKSGKGLFAAADLSRLIIAGYDLGAQTAAAMIGEKSGADLSQAQDFKPLAAILFSPSVDMALGQVATRYKNISIPLLVVTGSEDDDPYGISSPYVRTAIWEYAPLGNKYLLLLNKGNHHLLAGSNLKHRQEPGSPQESSGKTGPGDAMPRFGGSFQGGGGPAGGPPPGGMTGRSPHGGRQDSEQDFKHIAAVFSVSGAFLDGIGKSDAVAQSWISGKPNHWLKKSSNLKMK